MVASQGSLSMFAAERQPLLMLMDGHAMVHRAYRAIATQRNLTISATGEDVTGVFGFVQTFLRALQEWRPAYCAIAFDTAAPTFRHQQFADYKAQRPATPEELRGQFGRVKELMTAFGVAVFELDGWEADDVIGSLTRQAEESGLDAVVLTGDRDTFQLISPQVRVDLASSIQERKVYDEAELAARYSGLGAAQQPDFKALVGDNSDNIPGVPKVGEKRAAALLNEYGNLEGIYENLPQVKPPSVRTALEEHRARAFTNRTLMTIDRHSPIELDLAACAFGGYDRQAIVNLLTELEFFTVIPRVPAPDGGGAAAETGETAAPEPASDYQMVQTAPQLAAMIAAIEEAGSFAFDTETTAVDPMQARLVGLSFATAPGRAWYIPVGHQSGQQLTEEEALAALRPLFESPAIAKGAHNANYDMTVLAERGIQFANVDFDTMIAAHLLGHRRGHLGLKDLSQNVLGRELKPITDLIGKGRKQITFDAVDLEAATEYAAADADVAGRLRAAFEPQLARDCLDGVMRDPELAVLPVLVQMQRHGIKLDAGVLREMAGDLAQQMAEIEHQLYDSIGHQVNINSPQQLSDVLFKELGLPRTKRTATGYSTDADSLEGIRHAHPVVGHILEFRQVAKLKSTYVDALPEMVNPHTGRIHTSYNQTGSATGRISSNDPNLQNIPVRTELGRQVRRAFVAEGAPDWQLFSADYSQIELRVLAHMSQDAGLLDAFRRGEDIHAATAALMFDVPLNGVDGEMRRIAKVLNFGVIYGLSAHGISQQTGFSREQGAHFIQTYFDKYPGISAFLEEVKAKARAEQYVETLLGRRRYLPEITSSNHNTRAAAERMAINMPIQGTAADIMKLAMIRVQQRLAADGLRSRMLLQVHDELVFEAPQEELAALKAAAFDEMPAAMNLDVTLKVEAKQAPNWGDME